MSRKSMIKEATALASDICKAMAKSRCCVCKRVGSKSDGFCAHHIIRRGMGGGNYKTRFNPYNLLWVCPNHHTGATDSFHNISRDNELAWVKRHEPSHYAYVSDPEQSKPLDVNPDVYLVGYLEYLKSIKEYINGKR